MKCFIRQKQTVEALHKAGISVEKRRVEEPLENIGLPVEYLHVVTDVHIAVTLVSGERAEVFRQFLHVVGISDAVINDLFEQFVAC